MTFRFTANEVCKLLPFLREHVPQYPSVKALKKAIESRSCTVNGNIVTFSTHLLGKGDRIVFEMEGAVSSKLEVLYEDDAIVALNKPAGLVCENEHFHKALPKEYGKTLLVHRLDKDTSGVILLAKDLMIKEKMIALFQKKEVVKKYVAIVHGHVEKDSGKEESYLAARSFTPGQTSYGSSKNEQGKHALTYWKVLCREKSSSLLLCEPITGRTHQLRVHLAEMGHPIMGDLQYGKRAQAPVLAKRQLLHAYSLQFPHPLHSSMVSFSSPLPEDFTSALKKLHMRYDGQDI